MQAFYLLPRWLKWGLLLPLLVLNGWLLLFVFGYFKTIITVFIIANLLAFLLDYGVSFLSNNSSQRSPAVFFVLLLTIFVLGVVGITLAPVIWQQLNELVSRLPSWIESGTQQLEGFNDWAEAHRIPLNLEGLEIQLTERLSSQVRFLSGQLLGWVLETISSVVNIILTLVLTFYLLLHGRKLWDGIGEWLPQPIGNQIRQALRQNFHNYFIGQASLAAIIGITMTLAFGLLQVPFSLLFGLGVGFMALFPFGATLSIWITSLLMALKSFWLGLRVLAVAIIIEQVISNGIAPRLLGGFIGLNPVWILLALLIGAKVAGLLGIIIAVPMAGFIKSIAKILRESNSEIVTETSLDIEKVS